MTRRMHWLSGLMAAATLTGCVTHHHHGERVVYRTPPHHDDDVQHDPPAEPLPAPGTYGDDDGEPDHPHGMPPGQARKHDYAERAMPPWYVTSSPDDAPRRVPPAGPSASPQGKPPAHAPAKGLRRKTAYFYYPSCEVYYCPSRSVYYWIETDKWIVGVELPERFRLDADKAVPLRLLTDKPHDLHEQVRRKHGPKTSRMSTRGAKGPDHGNKKPKTKPHGNS